MPSLDRLDILVCGFLTILPLIWHHVQGDSFTTYNTNPGCFAISRQRRSYGKTKCRAPFQLAYFDSLQQMESLAAALASAGVSSSIVGVKRQSSQYKWDETGEVVDSSLWASDISTQDCAILRTSSPARLKDVSCDDSDYYLCRRTDGSCDSGAKQVTVQTQDSDTTTQETPTTVLSDPETTTPQTTTLQPDPQTTSQTTTLQPDPQTTSQTTTLQPDPQTTSQTTTLQPDPETTTKTTTVQHDPETTTPQTTTLQPDPQTTSQTTTLQSDPETTSQTTMVQPDPETTSQTTMVQPDPETTSQTTMVQPDPETTSQTTMVQPDPETTSQTTMLQPDSETTSQTTTLQPDPQTTSQITRLQPSLEMTTPETTTLQPETSQEQSHSQTTALQTTVQPPGDSTTLPQIDTTSTPKTNQSNATMTTQEATTSSVTSHSQSPTTVTSPKLCKCWCKKANENVTTTESELAEKVKAIKSELTLSTHNLSATLRKKQSIMDRRTSAQVTGVVGVIFLVSTLVLVILMDLHRVFSDGNTSLRCDHQVTSDTDVTSDRNSMVDCGENEQIELEQI